MFYIVETEDQIQYLQNLHHKGCFVHVVSTHDEYHPILSDTVAVYIRPLDHKQGYIVPISHPEGVNTVKDKVSRILSSYSNVYVADKKELLYHFNIQHAIDVSLLYSMTHYDRLDIKSLNLFWFYNKYKKYSDINRYIPLSRLHEYCEIVYESCEPYLSIEMPSGFDFYNTTATNVFYLIEQNGLGIYYKEFNELFKPKDPLYNIDNNVTYTSYNLYNSTSRPTNAFNSVNFAAIPKEDSYRRSFRPTNDYFVEFDFDGYHLRLLSEQIDYDLTEESAHKQLARLYFGKDDITEDEYSQAKQINFHAIYGKIPEKHKNLRIFKLIQEYIDNMWEMFNEGGVIWNPQSGKPFTKELKDMHPAKLMNYMMQSLETSRNILILKELLRYLKDKRSKVALYIYDAIIIDFSKEDGKQTLQDIKDILEESKKYPVKFKFSENLVL